MAMTEPHLSPVLRTARSALGAPFWQRGTLALYHGDCLDLMAALPAGCVDLTVTSPPYNIGKAYEKALPIDEYLDWSERWMAAVHRITRPAGAFWLNLGYVPYPPRGRAVPLPYLLWDRTSFYLVQEVVWHYAAGVAARHSFSPRNEKWLWYVRDPAAYTFNLDAVRDPDVKYPNQKKNGRLRVNQAGKNPGDVWIIPKVTTGQGMDGQRASPERTKHPAQFPLAVVDRIIRAASNQSELVLDPFVGSGSALEAAFRADRVGIGFDTSREYLEIAANRLERVIDSGRQLSLISE
jgi:adenine-specific DNA-methyltransferase